MAFAHYLIPVPAVKPSHNCSKPFLFKNSSSLNSISSHRLNFSSSSLPSTLHKPSSVLRTIAKAKPQEAEVSSTVPTTDAFTQFKHLLLPITDRNPYLSEGTKQAISTTTALAKKHGADITVVVIDEQQKESLPEHETQLSSIRWHISEGGFKDYNLLERLGEGSKPTAIIGDVADDLNLDLVVMSMEAVHTKHIDANLLAEFIPCPVMLLPL